MAFVVKKYPSFVRDVTATDPEGNSGTFAAHFKFVADEEILAGQTAEKLLMQKQLAETLTALKDGAALDDAPMARERHWLEFVVTGFDGLTDEAGVAMTVADACKVPWLVLPLADAYRKGAAGGAEKN